MDEKKDKDFYSDSSPNRKCSIFPDYIIKPILEDVFLPQLYQIVTILLNFKQETSQSGISFADIILDLINKIIKTKVSDFQCDLKKKFVGDVLHGQTRLMRVLVDRPIGLDCNVLVKTLKGNLKLLKTSDIIDLLLFEQAEIWLFECFKIVQFVLTV